MGFLNNTLRIVGRRAETGNSSQSRARVGVRVCIGKITQTGPDQAQSRLSFASAFGRLADAL
jgi:hypothetical protein